MSSPSLRSDTSSPEIAAEVPFEQNSSRLRNEQSNTPPTDCEHRSPRSGESHLEPS